jgi:hypothetical protein
MGLPVQLSGGISVRSLLIQGSGVFFFEAEQPAYGMMPCVN